jgi:hypothetical protein
MKAFPHDRMYELTTGNGYLEFLWDLPKTSASFPSSLWSNWMYHGAGVVYVVAGIQFLFDKLVDFTVELIWFLEIGSRKSFGRCKKLLGGIQQQELCNY